MTVINGPAPAKPVVSLGLSPARQRVLEWLRMAQDPVTVSQCAATLDLHENTARNHLEALADDGLAVRSKQPSQGRGRPRTLYRGMADPRNREYAALAAALARIIVTTSDDPQRDARDAGEIWGAQLSGDRLPDSAREARTEVVKILDDLGFEPRPEGHLHSVALTRCPLLDVARQNTDVVCCVHLGLVQGALEQMGHPNPDVQLFPFAEPGACRLHL